MHVLRVNSTEDEMVHIEQGQITAANGGASSTFVTALQGRNRVGFFAMQGEPQDLLSNADQ